MGRSLKRGPFVDEKLFGKVNKQTEEGTPHADVQGPFEQED